MDVFIGGICESKLVSNESDIHAYVNFRLVGSHAIYSFVVVNNNRKSKITVMNNKGTNAYTIRNFRRVCAYCVRLFCICVVRLSPSGTVHGVFVLHFAISLFSKVLEDHTCYTVMSL